MDGNLLQRPDRCRECGGSCIKSIAFLQGIPEDSQSQILLRSNRKTLHRGDYLFREDKAVDALYVISCGQVKLNAYDSDGREKIIGIFSDGDAIC